VSAEGSLRPKAPDGADPRRARIRALQGARAGFVSRTLANGIDGGVVLVLLFGAYLLIAVIGFLLTRAFRFPTPTAIVSIAIFWGIAVAYMTLSWSSTGKTVGKHLVGLRVRRGGGSGLSVGQALLRALTYTIFLPGFAVVLVSHRNRSLQDDLLGTAVVYDWSYRPVGG
jgi:uncharacterized RDD family membrane protein YckC